MFSKIYHGSCKRGLSILEPKVSSHEKPYVYGTVNPSVALLFLARWNDYVFRVGYDKKQLYIVENFEGALKLMFHRVSGYLYELEPDTFVKKKELWHGEVVSSVAVNVLKDKYISNIFDEIVHLDRLGNIKVYNYPLRPDFYPKDDQDLIDRLLLNIKRFGKNEVSEFLKYHERLRDRVNQYVNVMK